jgi:hypothetical protein
MSEHDDERLAPADFARASKSLRDMSDAEFCAEFDALVARDPRAFELATPEAQLALLRLSFGQKQRPKNRRSHGVAHDFLVDGGLIGWDDGPPPPVGLDRDLLESWGEVRLIVGGKPVTRSSTDGVHSQHVTWYLLPLLESFVTHWERLFNLAPDGTTAGTRPERLMVPLGMPLPVLEFEPWVHRVAVKHPGGYYDFPAMRFDIDPYLAHVDRSRTATAIRDWVVEVAEELAERVRSRRVVRLLENARVLPTFDTGPVARAANAPLQRAVLTVASSRGDKFRRLLEPYGREVAPLRLVFGSMAPSVTEPDVETLGAAVEYANLLTVTPTFKNVRSSSPLKSGVAPWRQGQELALGDLQALDLDLDTLDYVDVVAVLTELSVPIERIRLSDPDIRAVAIGAPSHMPLVLVNNANTRNRSRGGLRFTYAHELCHVLHDQGSTKSLGVADGPWAPYEIEQRANAYAAMFLMPPTLVERVIRQVEHPTFMKAVGAVAKRLRTSQSAASEHLKNLLRYRRIEAFAEPPTSDEPSDGDENDGPQFLAA